MRQNDLSGNYSDLSRQVVNENVYDDPRAKTMSAKTRGELTR